MNGPVHARADLRRWLLDGAAPRPRTGAEAGRLAAAAAEQGLVGLLHTDVVAQGVPWPGGTGTLRAAHHQALARGVGQLDAAARVQALLRDRGLRSLPLKGAALAERLYDTVGHRPMADVDILALDDFAASVAALRDAGFAEAEAADHARSFVDPRSGTVVELHHSVTSPPGLFPVDAEGLWTRSVAAEGQVARVPCVEDLLVQLSLHAAFQHGLVLTLVQYLDFRRLFDAHPAGLQEAPRRGRPHRGQRRAGRGAPGRRSRGRPPRARGPRPRDRARAARRPALADPGRAPRAAAHRRPRRARSRARAVGAGRGTAAGASSPAPSVPASPARRDVSITRSSGPARSPGGGAP